MISFLSVAFINMMELPDIAVEIWGWALVGLVALSLVAVWVSLIPSVFAAAKGCFKKVAKADNKESTQENAKATDDQKSSIEPSDQSEKKDVGDATSACNEAGQTL